MAIITTTFTNDVTDDDVIVVTLNTHVYSRITGTNKSQFSLLNLEGPALPSSLRLNGKNSITDEYPFWFNQTIQLDELDVSTNSTMRRQMSEYPCLAALCSGVSPLRSGGFLFEALSKIRRHVSRCPLSAAMCSMR